MLYQDSNFLQKHTWQDRVLIIFEDIQSIKANQQIEDLLSDTAGIEDRDLVVYKVKGNEIVKLFPGSKSTLANNNIRKELKIGKGQFAVVLIGKDGGVKLKKFEPTAPLQIYGLIDSMPMRRQEIKSKG